MAVTTGALYPPGTRIMVRRAGLPLDPALVGRTGVVVMSDEYRPNAYTVLLDGDKEARVLARNEVAATEAAMLSAPRQEAKRRRALP